VLLFFPSTLTVLSLCFNNKKQYQSICRLLLKFLRMHTNLSCHKSSMIKLKQWHFSINLEDNLQTKQMPCSTFPPLPRILLFQNNQQYWSKNWLLLKLLTMHNDSSCYESSMFQLKQRHFSINCEDFRNLCKCPALFPSPLSPVPKQTTISINWSTTSSMQIKKILSNIAVNH